MQSKLDDCALLIRQGCAEDALATLDELLGEEQLTGFDKAMALNLHGRACFPLGKVSEALKSFTESSRLMREMHSQGHIDTRTFVLSLQNLAHALSTTGEYDAAQTVASESADLVREKWGETSPQFAECLFHMSELAYLKKDYKKAEHILGKAASIWEAQSALCEMYGTCLNNLGRVCEEKGDIEAGIEWHRKAVEYRRKLPNCEDLAFSLGNCGLALASAGELSPAIASLCESQSVYESIGKLECRESLGFRKNLQILEQASRKSL